ncbi:hypothetical protein SAMN05421644_11613 [Allochromatium warmingii]|uniref:Uncharacterized protein n=1 Tax=Allochromatium warmingii TaxID=61595 RepID=A0A1H3F3C1_ALLWA|nr:hypothetical protein [Allochromatium warmingii]SDX85347.1 hypothetical protein SAMN05421644_11613 [Allochromatium warmingii]
MPRVTPDLLPPATPLVPTFPLSHAARALTLYPAASGQLCVQWRLTADTFVTQGARFPPTAGAPHAVLRLGRRRINGDCEPIREQALQLSGLQGSGEVCFQIDDDGALFEAELGLTNADGGWALLARSNQLQAAYGLGLEALTHPRPSAPCSRAVSIAPADVNPDACAGEPPADAPPLLPAIWVTAIPLLTYADPTPTPSRVVIEVELVIRGWSAPNVELDLFGQSYRVGAGGRFQLQVRVEDAELIRRALALHPLSESIPPR